jgi:Ca2+-binding EF-hand superfamily protein
MIVLSHRVLPHCSDAELAKGLISLDKNKDGQIDFNEFMNWLRWDAN